VKNSLLSALVVGAVLAAAAGCASPPVTVVKPGFDFQKIHRVAVLGVKDFAGRAGSGDVAGSIFEKYLLQAGYDVVERRQVDALIKEQSLDVSGAVDPKTAKKLGKLLGVDALVLGGITEFSPDRQQLVQTDLNEETQDPILRKVTHREKEGDQWVNVEREEVTGYKVRRSHRKVPQAVSTAAQVGMTVRLVDIETGGVLWIGSDTQEGSNVQDACESVARRIIFAVKKTWPGQPRKGS